MRIHTCAPSRINTLDYTKALLREKRYIDAAATSTAQRLVAEDVNAGQGIPTVAIAGKDLVRAQHDALSDFFFFSLSFRVSLRDNSNTALWLIDGVVPGISVRSDGCGRN